MNYGLSRDEIAKLLSESGISSPLIVDAVYNLLSANNAALVKNLSDNLKG